MFLSKSRQNPQKMPFEVKVKVALVIVQKLRKNTSKEHFSVTAFEKTRGSRIVDSWGYVGFIEVI